MAICPIYRRKPITRHPAEVFRQFIPRTLYYGNSVNLYRIWSVMTCFCLLNIETSTGGTNSMPLLFRQDNLRVSLHRGSFAVRNHLRSNLGIISGLGIIYGQGSFAALYNCLFQSSIVT